MDEEMLLLLFSEWLDTHGLMKPPYEGPNRNDATHEDLAREFLSELAKSVAEDSEGVPGRAVREVRPAKSHWPTPKDPPRVLGFEPNRYGPATGIA